MTRWRVPRAPAVADRVIPKVVASVAADFGEQQ
jgi:hypothetical protein